MIKIPALLFICKHQVSQEQLHWLVAELLPQVQKGFMHHSLQISLERDGWKGQLEEASVVWKVLLKLAPLLQEVFLETTSFKMAEKYEHIRI